jgi:cytochrome P450
MRVISRYDEVVAALEDPAYVVPPAVPAETGVAWLRSHVARFSEGADHDRRRAMAVAELDKIGPEDLRTAAGDNPTAILAAALGLPPDRLPGVVSDVAAVARVYLLGEVDPEADAAVERLVAAVGGASRGRSTTVKEGEEATVEEGEEATVEEGEEATVEDGEESTFEEGGQVTGNEGDHDEATAARIGLLVQAHTATATLVARSIDSGRSVAETVRVDSPVPGTRRLDPDGDLVFLDFTKANAEAAGEPVTFGAGRHRCPGKAHALAVAEGLRQRSEAD